MEIQNYVFFSFLFFFNPWQILSFMSSQQMKTRQEWTDLKGGGAYAKRFKFIKGDKRAVSGWKPFQNWLSRGLGAARVDTNML